jgi:DNA-binding Lrp family transcriptional regulator
MAVGFVLISAAPSKEHDVYNHLLKVPEIVELHPLFGEYDLIAKIEGSDFDTLGSIIVNKIRGFLAVIIFAGFTWGGVAALNTLGIRWESQIVLEGIVAVIAASVGAFLALGLFLVSIMKA